MSKNKLYIVDELKINTLDEGGVKFYIDGNLVQTRADFLCAFENAFSFPTSCCGNMDAFMDNIRDLDWMETDNIDLIIMNYSSFLNGDSDLKGKLIEYFRETILPYWEKDVLVECVGGKYKKFSVYLTERIVK